MFRRLWPFLLLCTSGASALTLQLRWSAPEPQLVQGQVQRPVFHHAVVVQLPATITRQGAAQQASTLREAAVRAAAQINRAPQDLRFTLAATGWVGRAQTGWAVTPQALQDVLTRAVRTGQRSAAVPVRLRAPLRTVRWAAQQRFGALGSGSSTFTGSPDFRVHNIRLGAAQFHGQWLEPGQTLDFNKQIGPVSAPRGFQPGYVLAGNTLRLEDGGGICQVSTTLFRAALRAGLPITERHAHSVQVAYYGAPGLDAAVYAGSKNLRFRNDTAAPLLIQFRWDLQKQTLHADLFGQSDRRTVRIEGSGLRRLQLPPNPTFVQALDLQPGQTRRIDMPAPGGVVEVKQVVTLASGQTRTYAFRSSYRPWGGVIAVPKGDPRG